MLIFFGIDGHVILYGASNRARMDTAVQCYILLLRNFINLPAEKQGRLYLNCNGTSLIYS